MHVYSNKPECALVNHMEVLIIFVSFICLFFHPVLYKIQKSNKSFYIVCKHARSKLKYQQKP